MIYIMDSNRDAINNYLKLAGLRCNYYKIRDFVRKCETDFSKNSVPEQNRIKAGCSMVWSDEYGAYTFTIKRMTGGYWGLLTAKGEPFKVPAGSFLVVSQEIHNEGVKEAILKTASEIQGNNF